VICEIWVLNSRTKRIGVSETNKRCTYMCNRSSITRVLTTVIPFKKFIKSNKWAWGIRWSKIHNIRLQKSIRKGHRWIWERNHLREEKNTLKKIKRASIRITKTNLERGQQGESDANNTRRRWWRHSWVAVATTIAKRWSSGIVKTTTRKHRLIVGSPKKI